MSYPYYGTFHTVSVLLMSFIVIIPEHGAFDHAVECSNTLISDGWCIFSQCMGLTPTSIKRNLNNDWSVAVIPVRKPAMIEGSSLLLQWLVIILLCLLTCRHKISSYLASLSLHRTITPWKFECYASLSNLKTETIIELSFIFILVCTC